ncbi:MAG TPA: 3'(2'),5'-bisphosphate nucleotidase CysQ [Polyangia bacterium]|nr:3'(2'),5'-bisphosphate nucleotidase CysQ [Polyangia bacterium]
MIDADYQRELEAACAVAGEAAQLVLRHRAAGLVVDSKPGDEPVTNADHAANTLIVDHLRATFPDDVVLSEEIPDDRSRLGQARVWMVDPIDGTRDFILGDTGFAVMIGLCVDGRPHLGVVVQPTAEKVYGGVVGRGAWLSTGGGARLPMHTSALAQPPGIRLVASKSHRTPRVDAVKAALRITDEINIGSVGLKIGLVAEATRDLYVYTGGRTKIWDTCGPEAILVAAGGRVSDLDGRALAYDGEDLYNRRGIVASNGPLHDLVIGTIAPFVAKAKAD